MKIRCQNCGGSGKAELPKRLADGHMILKLLRNATVAAFAAKMSMELTAAHHLMRRMVAAGVAQRVEGVSPAQYRAMRLRA